MADLDDKIAAAAAAKKKSKKKKSKKKSSSSKETSDLDNDDSSPQLKSPPEQLISSSHSSRKSKKKSSKSRSNHEGMDGSASASKLKSPPEALVGAVAVSNEDISDAERVKFGSGPGPATSTRGKKKSPPIAAAAAAASAQRPGAYSATSSDISAAESLKFGAASAARMPGAQPSTSMSAAESLKFGAASSGGGSGGPISAAENLKFGAAAAASMPGAEHVSEMSSAERLKFGDSSGAATMPGAQVGREMSAAERVKFGEASSSSSVARMPGAQAASANEMSAAERVKFGKSGGESSAKMPGASSASDMSAAERVKFGGGNAPGAASANADSMSHAERLKFSKGGDSKMPGAKSLTDEEVSAATRLKYGDRGKSSAPGAQSAEGKMSHAERLKFGAGAHEGSDVDHRESGRSSDSSQGYSDEEEGIEMQGRKTGDIDYHEKRRAKKEQDDYDNDASDDIYGDQGAAYDIQPVDDPFNIPGYNDSDRDSDGKRANNDVWRTLCFVCSCMSCAIIIGLAVGLAKASSGSSAEEAPPVQVVTTKPPSPNPTIAPTTAPEDFTWCYEANESMALDNENYAAIRSTLVDSGISTDEEFADDQSYQRKALCWLAIGDRLDLDTSDPFLEQRYALAAIFYRFDQPPLLEAEGWLSGKSECDWSPSIECDTRTDTIVSRVDLRGNSLIGVLPKEMRVLHDVTYLDLSANELDGDVSGIIGDWSHLQELQLSSNYFESFPSAIQAWKDLKRFDFSSNQLEGPIPENLALLTQLEYLDLAGNAFSGEIPAALGNMTSLGSLYMHSNDLEGSMPSEVCNLRNVPPHNGALEHLTVDCRVPAPEVECECCTDCNDYDVDRNPFGR